MGVLFSLCLALSVGVIIGFLGGGIKMQVRKKGYTPEQVHSTHRLIKRVASVLKYVTFLLLALGFIWCTYFLCLGAFDPGTAEYANNMAGLIVSLLTVISILFAFMEFVSHKGDRG